MISDHIHIQVLREDDLIVTGEFVRRAGWNQLRADWLRILNYEPNGCFAAFSDERLVGTVTTTTYGTDLAWIGMMLVHPDFRRRGIGKALMWHSISHLRDLGVECIKLDATLEGRLVYEHLGFVAEWEFHRWERTDNQPVRTVRPNQLATRDDQLDQRAFGADRSALLDQLDRCSFTIATEYGFGMIRSGRRAAYLGPVTTETAQNAEPIIRALVGRTTGPVFWDIPGPNTLAHTLAESLGFNPVRGLTRMTLGQMQTEPDLMLQFALAAPETG